LGSNGTNHGVEIHADVVEYARERLHQFIKTNPAIDEYEFCMPQFTQGNCLSLASNSRRYHRVYCGAACPETYELYMKHLLEIGGILVMPMNDQLLQVRRLGENSWTAVSMLPVSFATLLLPNGDLVDDVVLPPLVPNSLQELCRFRIRGVLKSEVEKEHPDLWQRSRKHPKQKKRAPILRRCVVPIFEESDDSDTQSLPEMDADAEGVLDEDEQESSEDERPPPVASGSLAAERRVATIRRPDDSSTPEDEGGAKHKREKFDSGVSDYYESSNERSPSPTTAAATTSASTSASSDPAGEVSTMDVDAADADSSTEENRTNCDCSEETGGRESGRRALSGIRLFAHSVSGERDRAALVIFESRVSPRESDSEGHRDGDSSNGEEYDSTRVVPEENYSYYMRDKLKELPLPFALKSFLNYDRNL